NHEEDAADRVRAAVEIELRDIDAHVWTNGVRRRIVDEARQQMQSYQSAACALVVGDALHTLPNPSLTRFP
ncbi:MAG TPA: hypothetical protein VN843_17195, partial [Anaerolineales bacterium]|nr:hypothetical protein [Anaerolineales bacterium]